MRFDFELAGSARPGRSVIVEAIHLGSGKTQNRWRFGGLDPGESRTVRWSGKRRGGRGWTRRGKHVFKVLDPDGGKADTRNARGHQRFRWYKHRFPLPARHTYGDGIGAGRGHQGQDLFARCGKPVRAARGGRVKHSGHQAAAGNYVVISGRGTRRDYAYMHLQRRGLPERGERVRTGERIGRNGSTGNASGCHLHFEIWSGPGWYDGGRPVNPTRPLRRWDRWS